MKRASTMTTIVKSNGVEVHIPGRARWRRGLSFNPESKVRRMYGWTPRNLVTMLPLSFEMER